MIEKEFLKNWGFNDEILIENENIQYETDREEHIWTINREYILKASKSEYEVINNIFMAKLLKKVNISTQEVINTRVGQNYMIKDGKYYVLLKKVQGTVLKNYFEGDYLSRANNIGKALAKLHIGLKQITDEVTERVEIFDNDIIVELNGWVKEEINKYIEKSTLNNNELQIFNDCISKVYSEFENIYYMLPRQVIHRDFHGENIILKDDVVAGFIDFDLSQINARLFDICYFCTASLATVFDDMERREKWRYFAREFINGYVSVNEITYDEQHAMMYMMISIEMIMVAYFAREGYKNIANNNISMVNYLNELWKKMG